MLPHTDPPAPAAAAQPAAPPAAAGGPPGPAPRRPGGRGSPAAPAAPHGTPPPRGWSRSNCPCRPCRRPRRTCRALASCVSERAACGDARRRKQGGKTTPAHPAGSPSHGMAVHAHLPALPPPPLRCCCWLLALPAPSGSCRSTQAPASACSLAARAVRSGAQRRSQDVTTGVACWEARCGARGDRRGAEAGHM